jgi:hypothetical protein
MYSVVLLLHSWIRWIALVAGVGATLAAVRPGGRFPNDRRKPVPDSRRPVPDIADRWGLALMMALDIQMLLGLVLYLVISPNMQEILGHFGEAMKDPASRFWAVEHISSMFVAVILVHVGRVLARKAPAAKRTRLLVCFGLATLVMMAGMPWPFRPGGRPLFRL